MSDKRALLPLLRNDLHHSISFYRAVVAARV
jgi:hypothetical protein